MVSEMIKGTESFNKVLEFAEGYAQFNSKTGEPMGSSKPKVPKPAPAEGEPEGEDHPEVKRIDKNRIGKFTGTKPDERWPYPSDHGRIQIKQSTPTSGTMNRLANY